MRNLLQYPLTSEEVVADLQRELNSVQLTDMLAPGSTSRMSLQMAIDYLTSKPLTFEHFVRNQHLAMLQRFAKKEPS